MLNLRQIQTQNEAKRKKYVECVSKALPDMRTEDIETLRTLCRDATGFKE